MLPTLLIVAGVLLLACLCIPKDGGKGTAEKISEAEYEKMRLRAEQIDNQIMLRRQTRALIAAQGHRGWARELDKHSTDTRDHAELLELRKRMHTFEDERGIKW